MDPKILALGDQRRARQQQQAIELIDEAGRHAVEVARCIKSLETLVKADSPLNGVAEELCREILRARACLLLAEPVLHYAVSIEDREHRAFVPWKGKSGHGGLFQVRRKRGTLDQTTR